MNIYTSLSDLQGISPCAFTIGAFDGVHRGHQALFAQLKKTKRPLAILTFATHPQQILRPEKPLALLTPLSIKLALLQAQGINIAVVLPFSQELAALPFDRFLEQLPLAHLILGKEATFGKDRGGNETNVRAWASASGIPVEYLEKLTMNHEPISSHRIRDTIERGDLAFAEQLLGRPHLIEAPAQHIRFSVSGLSMPPDGHYNLSHNIQALLTTTAQGRFIELNQPLPEATILSFNPNSNIPLRGIHVI